MPPYSPTFDFIIRLSNTFVSYFFILSGFVMVIAYYNIEKKTVSAFDFYWNRLVRIYPVYILALVLMMGYLWISYHQFILRDTILSFLLLQAWWPETPLVINGAGWSLSVEWFFYLIFPILLNQIYYRFNIQFVILGCLSYWIFNQIGFILYMNSGFYSSSYDLFFYFSPLCHLNEFILGNGAGLIFVCYLKEKKGAFDFWIILVGISILYLLYDPIPGCYMNGFLGFVFVPFILVLSMNNGFITRLFKIKWLVILGEASFAIYILQSPVYRGVEIFLNKYHPTPFVLFHVFLGMLVLISVLLNQWIEQPIISKLKRKKIR
jgi:peptidoglycan/LPS O-acetylase OafA/YrhL